MPTASTADAVRNVRLKDMSSPTGLHRPHRAWVPNFPWRRAPPGQNMSDAISYWQNRTGMQYPGTELGGRPLRCDHASHPFVVRAHSMLKEEYIQQTVVRVAPAHRLPLLR